MAQLVHYGNAGQEYFLIEASPLYISLRHRHVNKDNDLYGVPLKPSEARRVAEALNNYADIMENK